MSYLVFSCPLVAAIWFIVSVQGGTVLEQKSNSRKSIFAKASSLKLVLGKLFYFEFEEFIKILTEKSLFLPLLYKHYSKLHPTGQVSWALRVKEALLGCSCPAQQLLQLCFIFYTPGTCPVTCSIYKIVDFSQRKYTVPILMLFFKSKVELCWI